MPEIALRLLSGAFGVREFPARKAIRSIVGEARLVSSTHSIPELPDTEALSIGIELLSIPELDETDSRLEQLGAGGVEWLQNDASLADASFPYILSVVAYLSEHAFTLLWSLLERNEANRVTVTLELAEEAGTPQVWSIVPNGRHRIESLSVYARFDAAA